MALQVYFIRLRGKVTGPYSLHQLRALHDRGQLGKFHEVSEDRQRWSPASSLDGLFPVAANAARGLASEQIMVDVQPTGSREGEWYYIDSDNNRRGPISVSELRSLVDRGSLPGTALVSQPGMGSWIAAQTALGTTALPPAVDPTSTARADSPAMSAWEDRQAYRRVRTGLTIHIVSAFLLVQIVLLTSFGMVVASLGLSPAGMALTMQVFAFGWFVNRIVATVGNGFFAAAPQVGSARALGTAMLVLSLLSISLFFVPLVGSVSLRSTLRDPDFMSEISWFAATGTLSFLSTCLVGVLDTARIFVAHHFLQAICTGLQAHALAKNVKQLMYVFGGWLLLGLLGAMVGIVLNVVHTGSRGDASIVFLFMLALLFTLSCVAVGLYWFIHFLLALFEVRAVVSDRLTPRPVNSTPGQ